jgi:arylsulfatase A-like enzyme
MDDELKERGRNDTAATEAKSRREKKRSPAMRADRMSAARCCRAAIRLAAVAALFTVMARVQAAAAAPRPNIIVILADDVGYSDIGCFGGEIQTPNLDALARNGLRFTQFYNTARCCPTRASLLTGLYPHQAGVGHMTTDSGHDGYRGELNRRCVTIAEVLRRSGYGTYMAGKWHVTQTPHVKPDGPKESWPLQRGFERFYGTIVGAGNYFDPAMLTRDNTCITALSDPEYRPARYYYTDALADQTVRFIREHHARTPQKPFFVYLAFTAAHWPLHAPEEDIARYRGKYDAGYGPVRDARLARMKQLGLIDPRWQPAPLKGDWAGVPNQAWEARCMEVYAAQLDRMDQGIGTVVDELRRERILDRTLIFYLQDNGGCAESIGRNRPEGLPRPIEPKPADYVFVEHRAPHTRDGRPYRVGPDALPGPEDTYISYGEAWANVSNTPFREYKHWTHEGGISTPLLVHWPEGIPPFRRGRLESQPGHLVDIMATCVDVAGAEYPRAAGPISILPMEGVSLAPAFRGDSVGRKNPIFWEHEANRAVRTGDWKLVAKENQPWELYDLKSDRTELHDMASSQPERARELAAQWDAYAARANVLPLGGWRDRAKDLNGNPATEFTLKNGDHLERAAAPNIVARPFTVTARFDAMGKDGVIVAQGGSAHGFALFVKNGEAFFALRRRNALTVTPAVAIGAGLHIARATVARGGVVSLAVDDQSPVSARAGGLLQQMPADGLDVGSDSAGHVASYSSDNAFGGQIESVRIVLE